jgi:hypothetical protein
VDPAGKAATATDPTKAMKGMGGGAGPVGQGPAPDLARGVDGTGDGRSSKGRGCTRPGDGSTVVVAKHARGEEDAWRRGRREGAAGHGRQWPAVAGSGRQGRAAHWGGAQAWPSPTMGNRGSWGRGGAMRKLLPLLPCARTEKMWRAPSACPSWKAASASACSWCVATGSTTPAWRAGSRCERPAPPVAQRQEGEGEEEAEQEQVRRDGEWRSDESRVAGAGAAALVAGAGTTAGVDADASAGEAAGMALEDLGGALASAVAGDWARELVAESRTRSGGCGAGRLPPGAKVGPPGGSDGRQRLGGREPPAAAVGGEEEKP